MISLRLTLDASVVVAAAYFLDAYGKAFYKQRANVMGLVKTNAWLVIPNAPLGDFFFAFQFLLGVRTRTASKNTPFQNTRSLSGPFLNTVVQSTSTAVTWSGRARFSAVA